MRLIRVPIAVLLTLSMPSLAFAQVPPPPSAPVTQPQPQPQPQPQAQPTEMTEDQKTEAAKVKYMEAEDMSKQGRWAEAVPLYEEAYYLVPGKHGFAHKVGVAAFNAGDCDKANTYLKHFLQYGDPEKQGDKFEEAKQILGEISVSGCATQAPTNTNTNTNTSDPVDNENPLGNSSTEIRQDEAKKAREAKKNEKRGLLVGGAVLTGFGVTGLIVGAVGLGLAGSSQKQLQDLSSNQTITGFPVGDYDCRDANAGCPSDLEGRLKTGNALGIAGMVGGGVLTGIGVALIAVYMVNKKKSGGGTMAKGNKPQLTGIAPALLPGGAGAAAEIKF